MHALSFSRSSPGLRRNSLLQHICTDYLDLVCTDYLYLALVHTGALCSGFHMSVSSGLRLHSPSQLLPVAALYQL